MELFSEQNFYGKKAWDFSDETDGFTRSRMVVKTLRRQWREKIDNTKNINFIEVKKKVLEIIGFSSVKPTDDISLLGTDNLDVFIEKNTEEICHFALTL